MSKTDLELTKQAQNPIRKNYFNSLTDSRKTHYHVENIEATFESTENTEEKNDSAEYIKQNVKDSLNVSPQINYPIENIEIELRPVPKTKESKNVSKLYGSDNTFQPLPLFTQLNDNVLVPVENVTIEEIIIDRPNHNTILKKSSSEKCIESEEESFEISSGQNPSNTEENDSDYFPSDEDEDLEENNLSKKVNNETITLDSLSDQVSATANSNGYDNSKNDDLVFIRESKHNGYGDRIRQKVHCCYFCNKLYKDLGKHFPKKHAGESEVAKLLLMEKKRLYKFNKGRRLLS